MNFPSKKIRNRILKLAAGFDSLYPGVRKRTLIELKFRMTAFGVSPIRFESQNLIDGQVQPEPIPGIEWCGGSLTAKGVLLDTGFRNRHRDFFRPAKEPANAARGGD